MAVGIGMLSSNIIKVIYERGEFTELSTMLTSRALVYYSIGMIGYGLMEVLNKAFYAMQDAKTPMVTSGIAIVLNVVFSILFVKYIGYAGLPLAASITSIITSVLMLLIINNKVHEIVDRSTIKEFIKAIVSAIIMGFVVYGITYLNLGTILEIVVCVASGIIVYILSSIILKAEIAKDGLQIIKKMLNKE